MNDTLQIALVLLVGAAVSLALAWCGRNCFKKNSAEDVERELLRAALLDEATHVAQAEYHAAQAKAATERIKRLQKKGITVEKPYRGGRLGAPGQRVNYNPPPPPASKPPLPSYPKPPLDLALQRTASAHQHSPDTTG